MPRRSVRPSHIRHHLHNSNAHEPTLAELCNGQAEEHQAGPALAYTPGQDHFKVHVRSLGTFGRYLAGEPGRWPGPPPWRPLVCPSQVALLERRGVCRVASAATPCLRRPLSTQIPCPSALRFTRLSSLRHIWRRRAVGMPLVSHPKLASSNRKTWAPEFVLFICRPAWRPQCP